MSQNRPDLTAWVFQEKLQDFKDQLLKNHIFKKVVVHVHVIEFQKKEKKKDCIMHTF